jgi:hypothetical protein
MMAFNSIIFSPSLLGFFLHHNWPIISKMIGVVCNFAGVNISSPAIYVIEMMHK